MGSKSFNGWSTTRTSYLYRSVWGSIRQDVLVNEAGQVTEYTYVEHPGSVFIVPVTAEGDILLVKAFRHTLRGYCWEVPAGAVARDKDEDPRSAAERELAEELGASCSNLISLGNFFLANGFAHHLAHFFLAENVRLDREQRLDAFEHIAEVKRLNPTSIEAAIRTEINDGDSAFAILLAMQYIRNTAVPNTQGVIK